VSRTNSGSSSLRIRIAPAQTFTSPRLSLSPAHQQERGWRWTALPMIGPPAMRLLRQRLAYGGSLAIGSLDRGNFGSTNFSARGAASIRRLTWRSAASPPGGGSAEAESAQWGGSR